MVIIDNFTHKMAAHCETGTLIASLNHAGLNITEPMAFGIGAGIFFGYFKTNRFAFPVIALRNKPGQIRKRISKIPEIRINTAKYRNPVKAEEDLDKLLEMNIPVSIQVDFFYMDYNTYERVHNNMHFINVIGKNGAKYIISDSYYPDIKEIESSSLRKARFAGGMMAPKGFMYYTQNVPKNIDYKKHIIKSIKLAAFYMLKTPVPFIGIKGINKFAEKIIEWPLYARDVEHLSHELMKIHIFLEDQGTGGGAFRFLYATFLKQSANILKNDELNTLSEKMMLIGDNWRDISLFTARIGKNRDLGGERFKELSEMIKERAREEKEIFQFLYNFARNYKS